MTNINENQHHSRPSGYTLLIALGFVCGVVVFQYWAEISDFARVLQIKKTLGL